MQRLLMRLLNKRMDACFSEWVAWVDDSNDKKQKMIRAVQLLKNRALAATLNTWYGEVQAQIDAREKMVSSLKFFSNSTLTAAFNSWYDWCTKTVEDRGKIAAVMNKIKNRELSLALEAWCDTTQKTVSDRIRVQTWATTKLLQRLTSAAFDAWASYTHERFSIRERCIVVAEAFIRRATLDKKYAIYVRWSDWVYARVRLRRIGGVVERNSEQRASTQMLRLWRSRYLQSLLIGTHRTVRLAKCLDAWVACHASAKEGRLKLQSILVDMSHGAVARALDAWRAAAANAARARQVIASMALKRYFRRWTSKFAVIVAERLGKFRSAARKLQLGKVHVCFIAWRAMCDEEWRRQGMGGQQFARAAFSRCFVQWYLFRCKMQLVQEAAKAVQKKRKLYAKRASVANWIEAYELRVAHRLFCRGLLSLADNVLLLTPASLSS